MFENLTARLARTVESLRGRGRITEDNVGEALRDVRLALLEADVALPVIKRSASSPMCSSSTPRVACTSMNR